MSRRLVLTIEDVFDIRAIGGLVVVPAPRLAEFAGPGEFDATLERPDASELPARLSVRHAFISPTPPLEEMRWACVLVGLAKAEAPIGTKVWIDA